MSYTLQIIFHSSSTPKVCPDVDAHYTKGGMFCVQYSSGLIVAYPLANLFSVAYWHGQHLGSGRKEQS